MSENYDIVDGSVGGGTPSEKDEALNARHAAFWAEHEDKTEPARPSFFSDVAQLAIAYAGETLPIVPGELDITIKLRFHGGEWHCKVREVHDGKR